MKIAILGYGKMGKEIEKIALQEKYHFVSIIDIKKLYGDIKTEKLSIEPGAMFSGKCKMGAALKMPESKKALSIMDHNINLLGIFFSECLETYTNKH